MLISKLTLIGLLLMSFASHAENILYLGDSHSHIRAENPEAHLKRFGNVLVEGINSMGDNLSYYSACGSNAENWVVGAKSSCGLSKVHNNIYEIKLEGSFPSVATLLQKSNYSKVIINLGDNLFSWKIKLKKKNASLKPGDVSTSVSKLMEQLATFSEKNCIWIGPTYHIEGKDYLKSDSVVDEFYAQLNVALEGKCQIIDSRGMVKTTEPGDGLHHSNSDSQAWANGVLKEIFQQN